MLNDLTEACREPIAEMASNGLTADKGWTVIRVRGGGFPEVEFSRRADGAAVFFGERWHVSDSRDKGGDGSTLAAAIADASANGFPL